MRAEILTELKLRLANRMSEVLDEQSLALMKVGEQDLRSQLGQSNLERGGANTEEQRVAAEIALVKKKSWKSSKMEEARVKG